LANPQSWKLYSYARNNPLAYQRSQGTSQQIWGNDALGRITASSETIGGTSQGSFSYGYNLADALVWETYPTGADGEHCL
jgi:hypothetical protein